MILTQLQAQAVASSGKIERAKRARYSRSVSSTSSASVRIFARSSLRYFLSAMGKSLRKISEVDERARMSRSAEPRVATRVLKKESQRWSVE